MADAVVFQDKLYWTLYIQQLHGYDIQFPYTYVARTKQPRLQAAQDFIDPDGKTSSRMPANKTGKKFR